MNEIAATLLFISIVVVANLYESRKKNLSKRLYWAGEGFRSFFETPFPRRRLVDDYSIACEKRTYYLNDENLADFFSWAPFNEEEQVQYRTKSPRRIYDYCSLSFMFEGKKIRFQVSEEFHFNKRGLNQARCRIHIGDELVANFVAEGIFILTSDNSDFDYESNDLDKSLGAKLIDAVTGTKYQMMFVRLAEQVQFRSHQVFLENEKAIDATMERLKQNQK